MNRNPMTLRHLYDLANNGYAISVFSVTKFSDDDIVRKKVGGFKKENDYLYQWWHNDKWSAMDGKLKHLAKYFMLDNFTYHKITGEPLTEKLLDKIGVRLGALAFSDVHGTRREKKDAYSTHHIEVKVYRNTKKEDHATDIYVSLEEMLINDGAEAAVAEFNTSPLNTIADMVVLRHDHIEVFEIKSKGDTLKRLKDQVIDYKRYADKVWVVIDVKLTSRFEKWCKKNPELSDGLGYISHDNSKLEVVQKAQVNFPNLSYLDMLWAIEKEKILVGLGLAHSATTKDGDRTNRIKKSCMNSRRRYEGIAKHVLKSRIKNFYNGKHPKNPGMELKDCAGSVPLTILAGIVYGTTYADQFLNQHIDNKTGCSV